MNVRGALGAWSPWSPADGLRWFVVGLAGLSTTALGWWVTNHQDRLDDQVGWTTVAVVGFLVVGYANISWLLQARFAIIQRREALLPADLPSDAVRGDADDTSAVAGPASRELVGGAGLSRYHLASCPLAAGKGWPVLTAAAISRSGRVPCGVCRP